KFLVIANWTMQAISKRVSEEELGQGFGMGVILDPITPSREVVHRPSIKEVDEYGYFLIGYTDQFKYFWIFRMPPRRDPQVAVEQDQAVVVSRFRTYDPPHFSKENGPLVVAEWIRKMERIFRIMGISEAHKMACAELQIEGAAGDWWEDYWRLRTEDEREAMRWSQLKTLMEDKFYPRHFRQRMVREFSALKQGQRSVDEYEREFARMS
ncbi:Unknown protein, partial [Striga hermonthica]